VRAGSSTKRACSASLVSEPHFTGNRKPSGRVPCLLLSQFASAGLSKAPLRSTTRTGGCATPLPCSFMHVLLSAWFHGPRPPPRALLIVTGDKATSRPISAMHSLPLVCFFCISTPRPPSFVQAVYNVPSQICHNFHIQTHGLITNGEVPFTLTDWNVEQDPSFSTHFPVVSQSVPLCLRASVHRARNVCKQEPPASSSPPPYLSSSCVKLISHSVVSAEKNALRLVCFLCRRSAYWCA